jgi:hypothetical protein
MNPIDGLNQTKINFSNSENGGTVIEALTWGLKFKRESGQGLALNHV